MTESSSFFCLRRMSHATRTCDAISKSIQNLRDAACPVDNPRQWRQGRLRRSSCGHRRNWLVVDKIRASSVAFPVRGQVGNRSWFSRGDNVRRRKLRAGNSSKPLRQSAKKKIQPVRGLPHSRNRRVQESRAISGVRKSSVASNTGRHHALHGDAESTNKRKSRRAAPLKQYSRKSTTVRQGRCRRHLPNPAPTFRIPTNNNPHQINANSSSSHRKRSGTEVEFKSFPEKNQATSDQIQIVNPGINCVCLAFEAKETPREAFREC